jgi:hypothetical protein
MSAVAESLETCAFWFPTPTLLPVCDIVMLRNTDLGPSAPVLRLRWADAQRLLGHLMKPAESYPPRCAVEAFPSAEELRACQPFALD